MAAGIALERKPRIVKKTEFRYVTKREAKAAEKASRGTHMRKKYGNYYDKKYWARTQHMSRRRYAPQPATQYKRFVARRDRKLNRNVRRGRGLQRAGRLTMGAGALMTPIVYGYIGYDLVSRGASRQEAKEELERTTFGMTSDDMIATAIQGYFVANTYYTATKPILGVLAEIVA